MTTVATVEALYETAMSCTACFGSASAVTHAPIDVPQPRWVGPRYQSAQPRVLIVSINPGAGGDQQTPQNIELKHLLHRYKKKEVTLTEVLNFQKAHMKIWGRVGKFLPFYTTALGLELDELSFLNVALCATAKDKYPRHMLLNCYRAHTASLAKALQPNVVLLSGSSTHYFAAHFATELPHAEVVCMMHYANREGADAERIELARVREILARHKRARCLTFAQAERQQQATRPGLAIRGTFSPARAWRPAAVARLARTLQPDKPTVIRPSNKLLLSLANEGQRNSQDHPKRWMGRFGYWHAK